MNCLYEFKHDVDIQQFFDIFLPLVRQEGTQKKEFSAFHFFNF